MQTGDSGPKIYRIMDVSLTRSCNYDCSYCNQRQELETQMHDMSESERKVVANRQRSGEEWVRGLNEFPFKDDYGRLIFTGGEPSLHPGFFDVVAGVRGFRAKYVITNLSFDPARLVKACADSGSKVIVQPSFHFERADFDEFVAKLRVLDRHGLLSHFIPVSIVDLPGRDEPRELRQRFRDAGFHASLYEFEGYYRGSFDYAVKEGFGGTGVNRAVVCRSSLTCIRPNGDVVYCQTDTYKPDCRTLGNICDRDYRDIPRELACACYGACHISSASWMEAVDPDSGETIWSGKNYRRRSALNGLREYLERKNYAWLSRAKVRYNAVQRRLRTARSRHDR